MPSIPKGVVFLFFLVTAVVLPSSAVSLDAEERQKEERARESEWMHVRGGPAAGAPNPPEDLIVNPAPNFVYLTWSPPSDTTDLDHYYVYVEGEGMEDEAEETNYIWYNLESCSNYTFGVRSVSATEEMSDPLLGEGKTLEGAPPAPQNLQVDNYTTTTVTLTWDESDTLCYVGYRVKWSNDGIAPDYTITNKTFCTVTDLFPNTHYIFSVSAFTSYGEGPEATVNQTTAMPGGGPPEYLLAEGISSSVIFVSWSHPASPPYYYTLTAPPCIYSEESVFGLSYNITGRVPCTRCTITVTSVYSDGSRYQASTEGTSLSGAPPPPEPCFVQAMQEQVTVSWEKPTTNCRLGQYNVNWNQTKLWGDREETSDSEVTTGTEVHVPNPVPYSQYSFEVSASVDDIFSSPASCSGTSLETEPGPPEITTVDSSGQGEVQLSWEAPAEENGLILNYGIYVDDETNPREEVDGNVFSASVKLNSCNNYSLWMKARNGAGWGNSSEAKDVSVVDDELPEEVNCNAADSIVEVCWMPYSESCPVSQYNLEWEGDVLWSEDLKDSNSTIMEWINNQTCYTISALPYTKYHVTLTVGNKTESRTCSDITPMAAPGPPAFVNLTTKNLTVHVAWNEPEEKNGIIDIYQVEWIDSTDSVGSFMTKDNSTFFFEILDVSCGETVEVTVKAKVETVAEFGEKSSPQTILLTNSVRTLNCESTGLGEISLVWTLMDTKCSVSFYNLTWTYDSHWSDDTGEGWQRVDKDEYSATVTSLPPYALVSHQIHVDNSYEFTECTATTPEEVPGSPVITAVDVVQDKALVKWEAPAEQNGVILGYGIFIDDETNPSEQVQGDVFNASVKLLSCKSLSLSVKALNGAGWGPRSEEEDVTIGNNIQTLNCEATAPDEISLSWTLEDTKCNPSLYNITWTYESLWSDGKGENSKRVEGGKTSATVTSLLPYSLVSFQVHVDNNLEYSECTATTLEGKSSPPTALKQIAKDTSSVTIQWGLPLYVRGKLVGWRIRWEKNNGDTVDENDVSKEELMYKITGLSSSSTYVVHVMALNGFGEGEAATVDFAYSMSLIIGLSVGGGILLIILLIGGFLLYRKQRAPKPKPDHHFPKVADSDTNELYNFHQYNSVNERKYSHQAPSSLPGQGMNGVYGRRLSQQVNSMGIIGHSRRLSQQSLVTRPSENGGPRNSNLRRNGRRLSLQTDIGRPNLKEYGRRSSQLVNIGRHNFNDYDRRPSQQAVLGKHMLVENSRRHSQPVNLIRPNLAEGGRRSSQQIGIGKSMLSEYARRPSQQLPAGGGLYPSRPPQQQFPRRSGVDLYSRRTSQQAYIDRPGNRMLMKRPSQQFVMGFDGIQER